MYWSCRLRRGLWHYCTHCSRSMRDFRSASQALSNTAFIYY